MRAVKVLIWRAWLIGVLLILIDVAADGTLRVMGYGQNVWLMYMVWGSFMAAVFYTTYRTPRYKFILGVSHTITIALLFTLLHYIQSLLGVKVNIGAEHGYGTIFALVYVSGFIPATISAGAALVLSMSRRKNIPKL